MQEIITIREKPIARIMYKNKPIVSCTMIDELHEKEPKTAYKALVRHKTKFTEGKHYFDLPYEVWSGFAGFSIMDHQKPETGFGGVLITPPNAKKRGGHTGNMIFMTEIGYAKLIKSFEDDLAWDVYDLMVENYFNPPTFHNLTIPEEPAQRLAMLSWVRSRKKVIKSEIKSLSKTENAILDTIDNMCLPFVLPASNQLTLGGVL